MKKQKYKGVEYFLIDKYEAYSIIDGRVPEGLFLEDAGNRWVAIDNLSGNAYTEDFRLKTSAMLWLCGRMMDELPVCPLCFQEFYSTIDMEFDWTYTTQWAHYECIDTLNRMSSSEQNIFNTARKSLVKIMKFGSHDSDQPYELKRQIFDYFNVKLDVCQPNKNENRGRLSLQ